MTAQAALVTCVLAAGSAFVRLFCSDPAVVDATLGVLPVVGVLMLCDGLNAVMSGVLRGAGRQRLGATINLLGYWYAA